MDKSINLQSVCPGDKKSFIYWSSVMNITPEQLNTAIIETGSLDADVLSQYISKDRSFFYLRMFFKAGWITVRSKFSNENKTQYS